MQNRKCLLCLMHEKGAASLIETLQKKYPNVTISMLQKMGSISLVLQSQDSLDDCMQAIQKTFPTFYIEEEEIELALQKECIQRSKTIALAESCTGGSIAAKLTAIPDASKYFLGSIVAYSNAWKERFLQVSRTTLETKGAVSRETVIEMVQGLLDESGADFVAAISGIAGPSGGSSAKPVGTVFIGIGKRGAEIDVGVIHAQPGRSNVIEHAVQITLGALWRRVVHNAVTFS